MVACCLAPALLETQEPAGAQWDAYRHAVAVVRNAVTAHGGLLSIQGTTQVSFVWEGFDYAPTQGRIPSVAWDTTGNGRSVSQDMQFDFARDRFVLQGEFAFPGGLINSFRVAGNGRVVTSYDHRTTRGIRGTEYLRDSSGVVVVRQRDAASATMPLLVMRTALARVNSLRYVGAVEANGLREDVVAFTAADGEQITLYFDAVTHLMTRRETLGLGSLGDEVSATYFFDYRTLHGLTVPHRIEIRSNGILTGRRQLERFATTAVLPDSLFDPPVGYTRSVSGVPPAVEMIADGIAYVERVGGSYKMLVVDSDEGLIVVDAPVSVQATTAALDLIATAFPARPLRYLVLTHHHVDHTAGLSAFAARDVTVLVAPGSEDYLRRMSTVRRSFGTLVPTDSISHPRIETLHGRRRIGKGSRSVEIIDVGPTSHAASMLAVYVPSQRLLFQGDLFVTNRAGDPVSTPEANRDLDRIIRRERLDVRTIGGVHGLNLTLKDLQAAISRDP